MPVKKIAKDEWQQYFNAFSKKYLKDEDRPEYAEIQILTEAMGAQPETQWMVLKGVTYDDKDDLLDIQMDRLNRLIRHPEEIYVDEDDDGWLMSFEVIQQDGTKNIIKIR